MMRTKYLTLINKFIDKYNKDHVATKLKFYDDKKAVYLLDQNNDIIAKAPNKQDLSIMLCVCEDNRTKKNEDYWYTTRNKWYYNPTFLTELLTRYKRGK